VLDLGRTYLRTFRVASSTHDAMATRLAVERALGAVDLHPTSLPRSAILCVRALRDCSRRLRLRATPDFAALNGWRQTTVAALDTLACGAVRPACGPVPATAEAVLFADETELLACLALDWCRGRFAEHWWWRTLFASRPCLSWTAVWLEQPEFIPAAVELVAEQREADSLARNVEPAEARQLLAAVVERFGLREIAVMLSRAEVESAPVGTRLAQEITPLSGDEEALPPWMASAPVPALDTPVRPPWRRWVAETELPPDLGVQEQAWLGIALVLQRAPRWARSVEFAEAIHDWIIVSARSLEGRLPVLRGMIARSPRADIKNEPTSTEAAAHSPSRDRDAEMPVAPRSTRLDKEKRAPREFRFVAEPPAGASAARAHAQAGHSDEPTDRMNSDPSSSFMPREVSKATNPPPPSPEPPLRPWLPTERKIDTTFGGIFYLLNAALQLGLYGDFTTPMQPGLALSVWDFLALVGRELAGTNFAGDPLWRLLAELAGREDDEAPGRQFEPPDRWHLPAGWLKAFPEPSIWHWSVQTGRMRVWHSEGFMIVDLPAASDTADEQLCAAMADYAGLSFELCRNPLTSAPTPVPLRWLCADPQLSTLNSELLERWLVWLCGYLRARLPRALGFRTGSTAALTLLLQQSARVQTSAAHVRVFFSLSQHPLEIRVAGLDRDPGWVPAAGRNFAFYYE
jgi:hypothetical protein